MNEELGIVPLAIPLLRYRWRLFGAAVASAMLVGVLVYTQSRTYTSTASFSAQSRGSNTTFASLASQFGLVVPGGDAAASPQFYADLLTGSTVLGTTAEQVYHLGTGPGSETGTLSQLLKVRAESSEERREAAIRKLRGALSVEVSLKTGVVTFKVRTNQSRLSAAIAVELLKQLDAFNQSTRQSRAAAERRFTERRVAEVAAVLREAEQRMQEFLVRNRGDFRSAPSLQFDHDRLERELVLRQQVYGALVQALEQAKIEEVRDTPVLTVIEAPRPAVFPDSRGTIAKMLTAFVLVGFIGGVSVIGSALARNAPVGPNEVLQEFARLKVAAARDAKAPLEWARAAWLLVARGIHRNRDRA